MKTHPTVYVFGPAALSLAMILIVLVPDVSAQIVYSATGQIDLELQPFFDHEPWPPQNPTTPNHETYFVGLYDRSVSMDGGGHYSVGGLCQAEFNHLTQDPGRVWFTTYLDAHSADPESGGGGYSQIELSLYVPAPFYYRFEAEPLHPYGGFTVDFNGNAAMAYYNLADGLPDGSFPLIYDDPGGPSPVAIGWDTYSDEGFLPEGLYHMSAGVGSTVYAGFASHGYGSVSLMIQMQGDTNLDGYVGIEDLNTVLGNWNDYVPVGEAGFGDLSRDGFVGLDDLNQVLANWNEDVISHSIIVPEPVTVLPLSLLSLYATSGRRRVT